MAADGEDKELMLEEFEEQLWSRRPATPPLARRRSRQLPPLARPRGLVKKAREITILCDADVSLVVFSCTGRLYDFARTLVSLKCILEGLHGRDKVEERPSRLIKKDSLMDLSFHVPTSNTQFVGDENRPPAQVTSVNQHHAI